MIRDRGESPDSAGFAAEVVEVWEDAAGRLAIHVEGAPVLYEVIADRSSFQNDLDLLLQGDEDLVPGWWRPRHWNEHAELVAGDDGPRLVALWDCGQVLQLEPADHPYGRRPGAAARRYLGLF